MSIVVGVAGQTVSLPTMQSLKEIVSVKPTDRKLPPIRKITRPVDTTPLPSISASLPPQPLPAISKEPTEAANNSPLPPLTKENERKADAPVEMAKKPVVTSKVNSSVGHSNGQASMTTVSVHSPTTALFQTSSSPNTQSTLVQAYEASTALNAAKEEKRRKLEEKGIRTWPILAVLSVFCCNPVCGLVTAMLTLTAENSYFEGNVLQARRQSRVANILLIISIVTGIIGIIAVISWVGVTCNSLSGCP